MILVFIAAVVDAESHDNGVRSDGKDDNNAYEDNISLRLMM